MADHFGMNTAFFTMGGLNLLAFLIVVFFLPETEAKKKAGPGLSFKKINASGVIKGIISFRLAISLGRGAFIAFLPIFAGVYLSLSATLIGILIAVNVLLMSLFGVYGGNYVTICISLANVSSYDVFHYFLFRFRRWANVGDR